MINFPASAFYVQSRLLYVLTFCFLSLPLFSSFFSLSLCVCSKLSTLMEGQLQTSMGEGMDMGVRQSMQLP